MITARSIVFFSSRTGAEPMTWLQKAAMRARTESKVEDFQAHDLRRTCATRLAEAGTPDAVLETILNHSLGKDVTHYNQYRYFHERQLAHSIGQAREDITKQRDDGHRAQNTK